MGDVELQALFTPSPANPNLRWNTLAIEGDSPVGKSRMGDFEVS